MTNIYNNCKLASRVWQARRETSEIGPLTNSSCAFVNSRAMAMARRRQGDEVPPGSPDAMGGLEEDDRSAAELEVLEPLCFGRLT